MAASAARWMASQLDDFELKVRDLEKRAARFDPLQQTVLLRQAQELQVKSDELATDADEMAGAASIEDEGAINEQVDRLLDLDERLNVLLDQLQLDPAEDVYLHGAQRDIGGVVVNSDDYYAIAGSGEADGGKQHHAAAYASSPIDPGRITTNNAALPPPPPQPFKAVPHIVVAAHSYDGRSANELTYTEGDRFVLIEPDCEGWSYVEAADGSQGYVLESYLLSEDEVLAGDSNISQLRAHGGGDTDIAVKSLQPNDSLEWTRGMMIAPEAPVIAELRAGLDGGALPKGFRPSTLAEYALQRKSRVSTYLYPALDTSGLTFRDLSLDLDGRPRLNSVPVSRSCAVVEALDVPMLFPGALPTMTKIAASNSSAAAGGSSTQPSVVSRELRIVLCNSRRLLSNLVTIRAHWVPGHPGTWRFDKKSSLPGAREDDGVLLVRSTSTDTSLSLLFELSFTVRSSSSPASSTDGDSGGGNESAALSCGWALLPLYTPDGSPAAAKKYDLQLRGGHPFEPEVELEASGNLVVPPSKRSRLFSVGSSSNGGGGVNGGAPRLRVRLAQLRKAAAHICDTLPTTILLPLSSTPLVAVYRDIQAYTLLSGKSHAPRPAAGRNYGLTNGICLRAFPLIADQPEFMVVLKHEWHECLQRLKNKEKRDAQRVRTAFESVIVNRVWPLLSLQLPAAVYGDGDAEKLRHKRLLECVQLAGISALRPRSSKQAPLLLAPASLDIAPLQKPFHTDEVAYNLLGSSIAYASVPPSS